MRPLPAPNPRPLRCASWDSEHQVVVMFGGEGSNDGTQVYDPATNTWTAQSFPAAPVPSVFGRTGAVTPQAGDYTAAQVGALADSGSNGVIKRTAANVTTAAAASDVTPSLSARRRSAGRRARACASQRSPWNPAKNTMP